MSAFHIFHDLLSGLGWLLLATMVYGVVLLALRGLIALLERPATFTLTVPSTVGVRPGMFVVIEGEGLATFHYEVVEVVSPTVVKCLKAGRWHR